MSEAKFFLSNVRRSLAPLNQKILDHPFIADAESGSLPLGKVHSFVKNQYYIVGRDIKSLAAMLSRASGEEELLFEQLLKGDVEAFRLLLKMAEALGLKEAELKGYDPIPAAASYTHYLAALALYGTAGEQAIALVVNLPVWGSNCSRLAKALRGRYGIKDVGFLEFFSAPAEWLEEEAVRVMEPYIASRRASMERAAKLIQAYELMFWDSVYAHG